MKDPGGMKELGPMAHRGASRTGIQMNQTIIGLHLGEMRTLESQIGTDLGDGMICMMAISWGTFVSNRCKHANQAITVMHGSASIMSLFSVHF